MCGHMQHSPEDIKRRLLGCIDDDRNVTDMATCLVIISALESMSITKKVLEETRLGLCVNEIRRKTNDQELSRRLKQLVKKWRETCLAEKINGINQIGPGFSGGSKYSFQSISPSLSAPSRPNSRGELSPYSLPSSNSTSPNAVTANHNLSVIKNKNLSPTISNPGGAIYPLKNNSLISSNKPIASKVNSLPRNIANVPKTIAANKRMRKNDDIQELPLPKRSKTNVANGFEDDCSRDSIYSTLSYDRISRASNDAGISVTAVVTTAESQPTTVRRSGRRRKSQTDPQLSKASGLDSLKQKMAVIGTRPSKVKTTSQIVADLAKRKGDKQLARRASILGQAKEQGSYLKDEQVSKNKMEHMQRFLKSQPVIDEITLVDDDEIQEVLSPQSSTSSIQIIEVKPGKSDPVQLNPMSPVSNMDLLGIKDADTADEILARLPPLDFSKFSIMSDDEMSDSSSSSNDSCCDEDTILMKKVEAVDKSKLHALHSTNIDCQNGTYDMDSRFKEWHETASKKSYQDTPLVILPYVVTDY